MPADDRRDLHLVGDRINKDALRPRRAFGPDRLELVVQADTLEGLAAEPRAADRTPAQRQKQPRLSELGQNRLLDRVERDTRPAPLRTSQRPLHLRWSKALIPGSCTSPGAYASQVDRHCHKWKRYAQDNSGQAHNCILEQVRLRHIWVNQLCYADEKKKWG